MRTAELTFAAATTKSVNAATRTIEAIVSDETIDRMGDVIDCASWQLEHYRSNPVVLFAHRQDQPIGRADKVWTEGSALHATMVLSETERAREVMQLFADGSLRAFSVGFRIGRIIDEVRGGRNISRLLDCELFEISAVSVPANPNALAKHKSLGLITQSYQLPADPILEMALRAARNEHRAPAASDDILTTAILASRAVDGPEAA